MTHPSFVSINDTIHVDGLLRHAPETADLRDLLTSVRSHLHV